MMNFPAKVYNDLMARIRRGKPIAGINARIRETKAGVILSGDLPPADWDHPWKLHPRWIQHDDGSEGWAVAVTPGFLNGADVLVNAETPLTADPTPFIPVRQFRNATGDDGEAYPAYFKKLGARSAQGMDSWAAAILDGSMAVEEPLFDEPQGGTRELVAADVVLHVDHAGIRTDTTFADPTTGRLVIHSPVITSGPHRYPYHINAVPRFEEPKYPDALDRLMGSYDEPNYDVLHLATLWLLSPPDGANAAKPGPDWEPYPQHFVFWNLGYAGVNQFNFKQPEPLTIHTGLAFGLLDTIGNTMLAPLNDAYALAFNALNQTSMRGYFWSI